MADYEFPPDLIEAQRAYDEADRRVQEVTDALPSTQEVMEGAMTDEQQEQLAEVREARLVALETMNRHPWWGQQRDRYAAKMALLKAARG
ncbi:hypothetical protein [Streptosporangium longisporum]|uniref:Uncharacterized protein n=1 Tax=Streptosporangium longisporum TaxID=46187 RepID=A0ABP6LFF4_9ACTN